MTGYLIAPRQVLGLSLLVGLLTECALRPVGDAGTGVGNVVQPIYVLSRIPGLNGTTTGRVSAVDPGTGRLVAAFATGTDLDAAISKNGATLFVASVQSTGAASTDELAAFATRDGKELWRVPIDDRMRYIGNDGPTTLVLSPDQRSLYVYRYRVQGTPSPRARDTSNDVIFWLAAIDAATGKSLADSITVPAPYCGAAAFQLVPRSPILVVTCLETSELRFVDLSTDTVTDRLSGFGPGGIVATLLSPDGRWLDVVTDAFQVMIVDLATHAVARRIDLAHPGAGKSVQGLAALSGDGTHLVVGEEIESPPGTTSATELQVYDTRTWQNVGSIHLDYPLARTLVPTPDGTPVYALGPGPNPSSRSTFDTVYAINLVDWSTHVSFTRPGEDIIRVFRNGSFGEPTSTAKVR